MKEHLKMKLSALNGKGANYNPRTILREDLDLLEKTHREFGDLSGIVFNVETNTIVSGHQRNKIFDGDWDIVKFPASDSCGTVAEGYIDTPYGHIKYREVRWDETKEKAANLAANQAGGDWDYQKRIELLKELDGEGFDLSLTGHSLEDIEYLFNFKEEDKEALLNLTPPGSKLPHSELTYEDGEEESDELITIKINLTKSQVRFLDDKYLVLGLHSRSDGIRYIIDEYRRGAI